MTVKLDLPPIRMGRDYAHELRFWTTRTMSEALDLSGRTYGASFRHVRTDERIDFAVDDTNAATGILVLRLTELETADLTAGLAEWDLKQDDAGFLSTPFAGRVPILKDVTP